MRSDLRYRLVIVFFLIIFTLGGCKGDKDKEEELESIVDKAITITQMLPEVKTLSTRSNYIGTVEADSTVYIAPKVSAEVLSANFEVGDHVEAGELLFTLDDSIARISLEQADAAVKSAQAGLNAAKANYEAGQAGYVAQQASNTATHFAAAETVGKLDTTGQQMQLAADSAYVQAKQAKYNSKNANLTYDYYSEQISDAEDKRDDLRDTRDNAEQALSGAENALKNAASETASLSKIKEQYEFLKSQESEDGNMTAEEFLETMGFSSVSELDQALADASARKSAAQSAVTSAGNAYASAESAYQSLDSTIDQLYFQRSTAENSAGSASISYELACESADLARRQKEDFDTYTRQTLTAQALSQVIGSDQQLAASGAQIKASGAQVDVTSANVDQANAGLETARKNLSYYSVSSPVSGTITEKNISLHNMATPSQIAYTIKGDAEEKIVFYVAEKTAKEMKPGEVVTLEKDGEEFAGTIIMVSNEVDASKGLYRIEASSVDPTVELPFDSNIKLRAASRKSENVLTVPVDAVYYEGEQAFVYINEQGTARRRDVKTGISEGDSIEIKEGLERTDFIITSWSARLKDGMRVMTERNTGKKDIVVVIER